MALRPWAPESGAIPHQSSPSAVAVQSALQETVKDRGVSEERNETRSSSTPVTISEGASPVPACSTVTVLEKLPAVMANVPRRAAP